MSAERAVFKDMEKLKEYREATDRYYFKEASYLLKLAFREFFIDHPEVEELQAGIDFAWKVKIQGIDRGPAGDPYMVSWELANVKCTPEQAGNWDPAKLQKCLEAFESYARLFRKSYLETFGPEFRNYTKESVLVDSFMG